MIATRARSADTIPTRSGFIPEIQGLRTVALLLVAVFHIWFDRVSGGVDVFLLISAYLMTRSLTDRAERGSITNPVTFLARKFARLLPAAVAAIALTLLGIVLLMPQSVWAGFAGDAIASATYSENFRLQSESVNYFAANDAFASPFQHFWSLSIQGQVFAIWAMIHAACDIVARRADWSIRRLLLGVFGTIFAASLAYSIWLTAENQVFAYFDTWARLWEFAAGSLLALIHPWIRMPSWLRAMLSTIGLLGVLTCGALLPVASSFPGFAALWPVGSAALVILATSGRSPAGAGRFLALPVLTRIGSYTYALYLTHWPVLVLALFWRKTDAAGPMLGFAVLLASAVISVLIVHLVERPAARWNDHRRNGGARRTSADQAGASRVEGESVAAAPASESENEVARRTREVDRTRNRARAGRRGVGINWRAALTIVTSVAVVLGSAFAITSELDRIQRLNLEAIATANVSLLGANAAPDSTGEPIQQVALVKDDWVNPGPQCEPDDPYRTALCYQLVSETGQVDRRILNIGNSHSTQLTASLLEVVERHPSWELRTTVAAGCDLGTSLKPDAKDECVQVWKTAERYIAEQHPDLVVVYGTVGAIMEPDVQLTPMIDWITAMKAASPDTTFLVMRDNPRLDLSPFDCAVQSSYDDPACVAHYLPSDQSAFAQQITDAGGTWIDLTDEICSEGTCAPVRGNVFVYLDNNHLTETYNRTLAGPLSTRLHEAIDWWPQDAYDGEVTDRTPGDEGIKDVLNK